ncbi:MAG: DUF4292 domain-containing protein [Alphaproteobacteria bacterium]|nr:DUF4292 domain-containing protein [Alphaproteobacteria bacterium]
MPKHIFIFNKGLLVFNKKSTFWIIQSTLYLLIFGIACRSPKKMQKLNSTLHTMETPIKNTQLVSDSLKIIEVNKTIDEQKIKDSLKRLDSILVRLKNQPFAYLSFNAKLKIDLETEQGHDNYFANISLLKDSIMYITIRANILGISAIGAQAIITKDSLILLNKIDKSIKYYHISYISKILNIKLNFTTLQNLLIGNHVLDSFIIDNLVEQSNNYVVLAHNTLLAISYIFSKNDLSLHSIKLVESSLNKVRTALINNIEFQRYQNMNFATKRNISVNDLKSFDVQLDFKEFNFNEPLKYGFVISQNKGHKPSSKKIKKSQQ